MYNSANVAERIKKLAKTRNVSVKQLLLDVGLGFNTMANMKTSMPKADNLAKIADYLDCSVDYLLGRTDVPEVNRRDNLFPIYTAARSQNGQYSRAGVEYVDQETLNRLRNAPETDEDF